MITSQKEIERRCEAIRMKMSEKGLRALIVFSQVQLGYSGAVRYISNFRLLTRKEYLLFPLSEDPVLILSIIGQRVNAGATSWISDIRSPGDKGPIGELADAARALKLDHETIGIVGLRDTMPHTDYEALKKSIPNARLTDATELLDEIRMVKSQEEIVMIEQTAEMADQCYEKMLDTLRLGTNELDLMAEVNRLLTARGVEDVLILTSKGPAFPGFINQPGPYTFQRGDHYIFSVEISGPSGYWTQIARPVCVGPASSQYKRLYDAAMEALEAGVSKLAPGIRIGDLVDAVVGTVKREGFKTGAWCGHGMGLDVGERPGLVQGSTVELREGMVITIHPHVLSQDEKQGIFLGDTFVVEKRGPRNLSRTACDFQSL